MSVARAAALLTLLVLCTARDAAAAGPEVPKVPFGNQPCQSLSGADQAALGLPTPVTTKPGRAPGTLPVDNFCDWFHGGTRHLQVGYLTRMDYEVNGGGNRSKKRQAPADLPGAFYDAQGGLWFTRNGYYVTVVGKSSVAEQAARLILAKL